MRSTSLYPITLAKPIVVLVVGLLVALGLVVVPNQSAQAVSNRTKPDKVTICHRTHAVTNPYRKITVSTSAVDGDLHNPVSGSEPQGGSGDHAGYVHNKVTQGTGQNPDVHDAPSVSNLFDPSFNYPANQKIWEDIIPPFSVVRGNTTLNYPGMNWTDIGKAMYYGLTYNNVDYAGYCTSMGAKDFADIELAQYLSDNPNASQNDIDTFKQSLRTDLIEQSAEGDPTVTSSTDLSALPSSSPKPKGPAKPAAFNSRLSALNTHNTANPNAIKQSLAGVVWKDMNSNGVQDNGEDAFPSVSISVKDPVTGQELTSAQLGLTSGADYSLTSFMSSAELPQVFSFANFFGGATFRTAVNTVTVTTDANGYFEIPYLPEGEWQVVVTTPDGWSYTYDSSGTNDGDMPGTLVPAGGAGFAWAGLVYTGVANNNTNNGSGGSNSSNSSTAGTGLESLSNTGMNGQWYIAGVIGIELIATGAMLMWLRRRSAHRAQR